MRNYKFRLADMMPNAWFYKLRDMNKARYQIPFHSIKKTLPPPTQIPTLPNLYNSKKINDPSTKSSKRKPKRKTIYRPSPRQITPSVSDDFSCISEPENAQLEPCFQDDYFLESPSSDFECSDPSGQYSHDHFFKNKLDSHSITIIEETFSKFNTIAEPKLPRILTKPRTKQSIQAESHNLMSTPSLESPAETLSIQIKKVPKTRRNRKSASRSTRVIKIKNKNKKRGTCGRKSVKREKKPCDCFYSESFAMVKASFDPEKDFRDSMKEMIVENNIRASKELEELLACYLSLNSNQYHDLIIRAFEQIWFTMPNSHL